MIISLILIAVASCQIEIPGGKCTTVPVMPDFELSKYAGQWYGQIKYPFRSKPGDKCNGAAYGGIDDISVSVNNSVIKLDDNGLYYYTASLGSAVQTEPEISGNKLYVNFPKPPGECLPGGSCNDIGVQEANYIVLDTDYENYTFVYTACQDMGSYTIEQFWIMARTRDFKETEMYEEVVQRAVEQFGFIRELAIESPQEDCVYDYVKGEEPPSNLALYPTLSFPLLILLANC